MTDIARLGFMVDSSGAVKATHDLDRLGGQARKTERDVAKGGRGATAALDAVGDSAAGAGQGFNTMAGPMRGVMGGLGGGTHMMRQMSYQLNQMAQSGAANGMWMQAMLVQIPDILGLMGSFHLVLAGGAVALAGSFLPALIGSTDQAKVLKNSIEDLSDAIAAYRSAADLASLTTDELGARFGAAGSGLAATLDFIRGVALDEAQQKLDNLSQSIAEMLGTRGSGDSRNTLANFFDVNIMLAFTDAQREARALARELTWEFQNQQDALSGADGDLDAQISALSEMLRITVELADMNGERSEAETELIAQLRSALELMVDQKAAMHEAKGDFDDIRAFASQFVDQLTNAARSANDVQYAVSGIDFSNANAGASVLLARLDAAWTKAVAIAQATSDLQQRNAPGFRFSFGANGPAPSTNPFWDSRIHMTNMPPTPSWVMGAASQPGGGRKKSGGRGGQSEAERKATKEHNEALRERERILRSLESAQDTYNRELGDLNDLYKMGYLNAEEFARAAAMLEEELRETQFSKVHDAIESVSDAMADAIVNGEDMGEALRGVFQQIARDLISSGISKGLGLLFDSVFGAATGTPPPTANANGNAFSRGKITAFAKGGAFTNSVVSQATVAPMALFGEAGPEAIMPLTRIKGKLGVSVQQQAVQPIVNMQVNVEPLPGETAEVTRPQDGHMNIRMVRQVMRNELASGSMDSAMRQRWGGRPLPKGS